MIVAAVGRVAAAIVASVSSAATSGWPVTYSAVAKAATVRVAAEVPSAGHRCRVRRHSTTMSSAWPWWTIAHRIPHNR